MRARCAGPPDHPVEQCRADRLRAPVELGERYLSCCLTSLIKGAERDLIGALRVCSRSASTSSRSCRIAPGHPRDVATTPHLRGSFKSARWSCFAMYRVSTINRHFATKRSRTHRDQVDAGISLSKIVGTATSPRCNLAAPIREGTEAGARMRLTKRSCGHGWWRGSMAWPPITTARRARSFQF